MSNMAQFVLLSVITLQNMQFIGELFIDVSWGILYQTPFDNDKQFIIRFLPGLLILKCDNMVRRKVRTAAKGQNYFNNIL